MAKNTRLKHASQLPIGLCLVLCMGLMSVSPVSGYAQDLEETVCGFREAIMFWMWSNAAGSPDKARALRYPNVEAVSFTTEDGRTLRGYRINAESSQSPSASKGYLLVAQGNAMLADQLVESFTRYADAGYDVYIYDYRGYGLSEGKRRLKAIVADYRQLTDSLNSLPYQKRLLYGISFGGIVILNVIGAGHAYDGAVIDSTPSRVSTYGCPVEYDPVNNLPDDGSRLMIVGGEQDRVVPIEDMEELLTEAGQRSATVVRSQEFAHPFMDREAIHRQRMEKLKAFLLKDLD